MSNVDFYINSEVFAGKKKMEALQNKVYETLNKGGKKYGLEFAIMEKGDGYLAVKEKDGKLDNVLHGTPTLSEYNETNEMLRLINRELMFIPELSDGLELVLKADEEMDSLDEPEF